MMSINTFNTHSNKRSSLFIKLLRFYFDNTCFALNIEFNSNIYLDDDELAIVTNAGKEIGLSVGLYIKASALKASKN